MERGNLYGFGENPETWKQSSSIGGNIGKFSPLTYSNWQSTQWFVGETEGTGHFADPEVDGLTNVMEYFMGLNPKVNDSAIGVTSSTMMVGGTGPFLTISFRQSLSLAATVTFAVEGSSDLTTWDNQTTLVGTPVNNGDGTQTLTYRDNIPIPGNPKRFLHVKAIVP